MTTQVAIVNNGRIIHDGNSGITFPLYVPASTSIVSP
jgi:hypothetical protein